MSGLEMVVSLAVIVGTIFGALTMSWKVLKDFKSELRENDFKRVDQGIVLLRSDMNRRFDETWREMDRRFAEQGQAMDRRFAEQAQAMGEMRRAVGAVHGDVREILGILASARGNEEQRRAAG